MLKIKDMIGKENNFSTTFFESTSLHLSCFVLTVGNNFCDYIHDLNTFTSFDAAHVICVGGVCIAHAQCSTALV